MGYYIQRNSRGELLPIKGKHEALIADGAKVISGNIFCDNMVCVVENEAFDAALYCFEHEFIYVKDHPDKRRKRWLTYKHAKLLSGFLKDNENE